MPLTLPLKSSLPCPRMAGRGRRSGELLPCAIVLNGSLAGMFGILDGLIRPGLRGMLDPPYAETEEPKLQLAAEGGLTEEAKGFRVLTGVCDLGACDPRRVPLRLGGGAALAERACAAAEGLLGVFARTGAEWLLGVFDLAGAALADEFASSSR